MRTEPGMGAPSLIFVSWLAAAGAFPFALVTAVGGQGLGALVGGCSWIGISLPIDRQPWALVNQPVLNFASQPAAVGYWWGSWLVPLLGAVVLGLLRPRSRSWTVELVIVQITWAAVVVAGAWLPLLDAEDGHLVRWLALHQLPAAAVWAAPLVAAVVGLVSAIRVLELARRQRPDLGRARRTGLVTVHLAVPAVLWVAVVAGVIGAPPVRATAGLGVPVAAAIVLAWLRFPGPHVRRLQPPTTRDVAALAVGVGLVVAVVWLAGRPLDGGSRAGLLWAKPTAFNNIRAWIEPLSVPLSF
jgi:hypothetical protein